MLITEPKIVKADSNWYIEYYELNSEGRKIKRHQLKCGLTRIKNLQDREIEAERQRNLIASKHNHAIKSLTIQLPKVLLTQALSDILELIEATFDKDYSIRSYKDMIISFKKYLAAKQLLHITCEQLSLMHVQAYFDYLAIDRKRRDGKRLSNTTHNNHKTNLRAIFNKLKSRGYIAENYFCKIENKKESEPVNRPFEDYERDIVMREIFETDPQLTYAVQLIYRCGIRSYKELCKLKPSNFVFSQNLIRIKGHESKTNERDQFITIPNEISTWLQNFMKDIPKNWYVLGSGKGLLPNPTEHFKKNALYERHKKILKRLLDRGELQTIEGLSIYQWKHTGAIQLIDENAVDIESLRAHLRHKDINTTQRYFKSRQHLQPKIQNFKTGLIPK